MKQNRPSSQARSKRGRFRVGEPVVVRHSWHSDITPGQLGRIAENHGSGYFVRVTAVFANALRPHVRGCVAETRCVFFRGAELRRAEQQRTDHSESGTPQCAATAK